MMIEVNLLPGAHKSSGRSINFTQVAEWVKEHLQDKYLLGTSAVVLLVLLSITGAYISQYAREVELNERAEIAAGDSAKFAKVLQARARAQASRDSVYQQLAIIRSIDNMRFTWAHVLEEINIALPAYTWLTSVTQTSAIATTAAEDTTKAATEKKSPPPASGQGTTTSVSSAAKTLADQKRARADSLFSGNAIPTKFRIIGQTVDIQALTLFMKNLEASPFIKNIQLTRSDLVVSDKKEVTEFQLEAESEVPAPSLIQTVPLALAVK